MVNFTFYLIGINSYFVYTFINIYYNIYYNFFSRNLFFYIFSQDKKYHFIISFFHKRDILQKIQYINILPLILNFSKTVKLKKLLKILNFFNFLVNRSFLLFFSNHIYPYVKNIYEPTIPTN